LIITGTKEDDIQAFKAEMHRLFKMSDLGLLSYYLGARKWQDLTVSELRRAMQQRFWSRQEWQAAIPVTHLWKVGYNCQNRMVLM
jgi:hypothetical protein